ncbi:Iron(3+)-hydroxamate import ATP-binding protein FhuC [Candidatus Ecksteinia adelgidicola]|nr:Iron(3+)-hydroxamate import ATP-binding protein FhuC [Candidatus Ecksteinia adelgidicola]
MIMLQQACIGYGNTSLFPPLTGHFESGSLTAVIGVNGAGKSTLLKTLAKLKPLKSGSLYFIGKKSIQTAYLPQQPELDRQFPILTTDLVAMGNWIKYSIFNKFKKNTTQNVSEALEHVDMTSLSNALIEELSEGQLKRALFARLLVQQAPLILLDEPFNGVDNITAQLLIKLIKKMNQQGQTLIVVLHDILMVKKYFPQVLLLTPKYCYWGDTKKILHSIEKFNISDNDQFQCKI